jgi:hypothetical protein
MSSKVQGATLEHYRGITWDLAGTRLKDWQAADFLDRAGFGKHGPLVLVDGVATMIAEAGLHLRAFHLNVDRDSDGRIVRDSQGRMHVKSADLGWIQKNTPSDRHIPVTEEAAAELVAELFEEHPNLAKPLPSALVAYALYKERGYQPWYGYAHRAAHMGQAVLSVANYLAVKRGLKDGFAVRRTP